MGNPRMAIRGLWGAQGDEESTIMAGHADSAAY
jgi:hypothetical protein